MVFKRNSGFALIISIILIGIIGIVTYVIGTIYFNGDYKLTTYIKRNQASNLAIEGIELTRGYMQTKINNNKTSGWRDNISSLNGKHLIKYDNGYSIIQQEEEKIIRDNPYCEYRREIEISNGSSTDEKDIKVTVYYGESNTKDLVQYVTTITNNYVN